MTHFYYYDLRSDADASLQSFHNGQQVTAQLMYHSTDLKLCVDAVPVMEI